MFRSYKPLDEELKKSTVAKATPEIIEDLVTEELGQASETPVLAEIVQFFIHYLFFFKE